MADDSGAKPAGGDEYRAALTTAQVRAFVERAPRCKVRIVVVCQTPGQTDTVEAQLVNMSRSGMFLASEKMLPIGTSVEFQFNLDEGLVVLKGVAEVVRLVEEGERGMGLRFVGLDERGQQLIDRIVLVSSTEPPPVPAELAGDGKARQTAVTYSHGTLRLVLSMATAAYFTYNPLLHIGIGGCFLPAEDDVPLGTGYQMDIVDPRGQLLLRCKAKVAAKQERRIGVRMLDVDRDAMLKLRGVIARLTPGASVGG